MDPYSSSAAVDVASIVLPAIEQEAAVAPPPAPIVASPEDAPAAQEAESTVGSTANNKGSPAKKRTPNKRAKKNDRKAEKEDGNESDLTPAEDLDGADGATPKKRKKATQRKPRKPKEPIVYDIPEIPPEEKKMTTYHGRLGYACLNTVLRNKRPAREAVFCSRTLRIDTIKQKGTDYMKELGKQNMRDLSTLIQWNEDNVSRILARIRFMRMSSEMFPFASHPEYGYTLEYAQEELKAAGDLAKKYGHRLTTHPGQFTQLGSPRKQVVDNSFRDLKYHCEMIDRMGLGKDAVMIIHGGGIFENDGGKPATLQRIKDNFVKLPENVQQRIVLENDDVCYSAEDLLPVCEDLGIPMVFDYHHDWIIPSSQTPAEMMPRILKTWEPRDIKPKQHLSEPRPGAVTDREKRGHSDRCKTLPPIMPDDMDLMIEAKDKEQAVLEFYRIYDLEPVIHENLRPPSTEQTLATKGRKNKSPKKGKKNAAKKEDGEGEEEEAVSSQPEGEDQGETDFGSTAGSVTGDGTQTDDAMTDGEEVIKPRASRSRSGQKAPVIKAEGGDEDDQPPSPTTKPKRKPGPKKGKATAKPEPAAEPLTEEVKPGVVAHDFVSTDQTDGVAGTEAPPNLQEPIPTNKQ